MLAVAHPVRGRATRNAISVQASTSTAMSASTLVIMGRSAMGVPNAPRVIVCRSASVSACHEASRADREIQPRQVRVRQDLADARPSSPTRIASVPAYSTSLEALERLPALSFRRCT